MSQNFKRFTVLWMGQLVSAVGSGLTSFGLGVYVFQQTGSAAGMALITLLGFLPTLVLSVPAGVLADRFDRRTLMMLGDGLSGLGILFILIRMLQGGATVGEIAAGVCVSAVFSSLLEPAYKATVTDLLTEQEYSKAGGLVSLAGSARYLISPLVAGLLLPVGGIKLLLVIDLCTFGFTVLSTFAVKRGIRTQRNAREESFGESLRQGWKTIRSRRGVFLLVAVSSLLTLFVGVFQVLAEPLVLSVSDAKTLGIVETVCASGMLVSGLYLGVRGIRSGYVRVLGVSLAVAGAFIIGFGSFHSIVWVAAAGFGFFAMLPFANNCLDVLVRSNIPAELQGRVWGIVGFLSQIGYVVAYGASGVLADAIAAAGNVGVGRGSGIVIAVSGAALILVACGMMSVREIRALEGKGGARLVVETAEK
ncbi:MAG: MFS transporter [Clostridia bacterium]|nr:MFS transporter [Clostridia bacterium]